MKRSLACTLLLSTLTWAFTGGDTHAQANDELRSIDARRHAIFYNLPGVSYEQYQTDRVACNELSDGLRIIKWIGRNTPYPGSIGYPPAHYDNCMRTRGYRRFLLRDVPRDEFERRSREPAAFTRFVSAQQPEQGEFQREWDNPYFLARSREESSWRMPPERGATVRPPQVRDPLRWHAIGPTDADGVNARDPEEAVVVLSVQFVAERSEFALRWSAFNPTTRDFQETAVRGSYRPRSPLFRFHVTRPIREPEYLTFVVPPAHYALEFVEAAQRRRASLIGLCLSTVVFEATPGAIIYLGDIVASVNDRGIPSLRIDRGDPVRARAALLDAGVSLPDLTPARLWNGFSTKCEGYVNHQDIGAYAIPGAPAWQNRADTE